MLLTTASIGAMVVGLSTGQSAYAEPASGATPEIEEIYVTGSYVKRKSQANMSSPFEVYDNEMLAKSGFSNLGAALALMPANVGSIGGVADLAAGNVNDNRNSRSANLRGLGPASTLVLLNGRRVASQERDERRNNYVNLDALTPMIAVSRIETVLDGASALYGSDAIAGVMNIITDDKFEGVAASAQYNHIKDAPGYIVQGKIGGGSDRFHAVASVSYEFRDNLQNRDRKVTRDVVNYTTLGQPGSFFISQRPQASGGGDLIIDNGVNGPVNYSQVYDSFVTMANPNPTVRFADPWCTVPSTGGVFNPFGSASAYPVGPCALDYQDPNPIRPQSQTILTHLVTSYEIADQHELYLELRHYRQQANRFGIASFPISNGTVVVPASNPYNPFGVNANFSGRVLGINAPDREEDIKIRGTHIVVGAKGAISDGWEYNLSGSYSTDGSNTRSPDTDMVALQNALNGFGGTKCTGPGTAAVAGQGNCGYFSPFGQDQMLASQDMIDSIIFPVVIEDEITYLTADFFVTGQLFELPGGTAGLAFGGGIREERTETNYDNMLSTGRAGFLGKSQSGSGSRTVKSLFAELYLPFHETLDVQLAARYETYGEFDTIDPKLGINWRPLPSLAIRASASTAFRAPALAQAVAGAVNTGLGNLVDPVQNDNISRVINTVSNPNLKPEDSKNFNLGFSWEPIDDLVFSVDYWYFDFKNQIAAENAQVALNANPTGSHVIRDQFGTVIAVNVGYFNAGKTMTDGVDFRLDYRADLGGGHMLTFRDTFTWVNRYKVQIGPNQPVLDMVGGRNELNPGYASPRYRNNAFLGWDYLAHSANVTMRYTHSVKDDYFAPAGAKIKSWTVFDAQYSFRFGGEQTYQITLGALNVFDKAPPRANITSYLSSLADPYGRQAYVRLDLKL